MIINEEGRIVVPIGETVKYDGVEYKCEAFEMADADDFICSHCDFGCKPHLCKILECFLDWRPDVKDVVFVKQEGGKDEK